ncbi:uncharacterized protein LOC126839134 isoform X2 [Adelges cooleyi]|uniref:uncharacterized protein LOC126839134 isoform X2 n=1 Tax=Adelges cooleyi TaxID=133065 RepID=UPI00217FC4AC|nr:uncharacterized protein LOC126839134 isoform X2 [Adelges cooleyi]
MKLFCLLVCFFFVDVLANDFANYKKYVFQTTETIKHAYFKNDLTVGDKSGLNGLEYVIETMNDNTEDYKDFCRYNFLLAVPEHTEILPRLAEANNIFEKMLQDIEVLIGLETLKILADKRRDFVAWAIKLIIGRRIIGTVQDGDDEASLLLKCRFLAIYHSTQYPELYITEVEIYLYARTCILTDKNDDKIPYTTDDAEKLKELIRLGRPQNPPTT